MLALLWLIGLFILSNHQETNMAQQGTAEDKKVFSTPRTGVALSKFFPRPNGRVVPLSLLFDVFLPTDIAHALDFRCIICDFWADARAPDGEVSNELQEAYFLCIRNCGMDPAHCFQCWSNLELCNLCHKQEINTSFEDLITNPRRFCFKCKELPLFAVAPDSTMDDAAVDLWVTCD